MNFTQEKLVYGLSSFIASGFSLLGAIMSPEDSRWVFVTLACSLMMSAALSLTFKRADETIRLVIGRGMISILSGIFLTKPVVWYFKIDTAQSDVIALGGVSAACCVFGFILGFAGLEYLMKKSDAIAKRYLDAQIAAIFPEKPKDP